MDENKKHHRKSIRLKDFDYSSSADYFVTIVTFQRRPIFGQIADGEIRLSQMGQIAHDEWFKTASLRKEVFLIEDEFVVMPNHVHGIIHIEAVDEISSANRVGTQRRCAPTNDRAINVVPHSLGAIVRGYKSAVTYQINKLSNTHGEPIWQRNYFEEIIWTDKDYERIEAYIANNPTDWKSDKDYIEIGREL